MEVVSDCLTKLQLTSGSDLLSIPILPLEPIALSNIIKEGVSSLETGILL